MSAELVAALTALAEAGIEPDIQELLVRGNPARNIAPGALAKALDAARSQARSQGVGEEQSLCSVACRPAGLQATEHKHLPDPPKETDRG